jgi:O-antigen ligase
MSLFVPSPDPTRSDRFAVLCFCGLLLVVLNLVIDTQAMDISLIPRLLALQFILLLFVVLAGWSGLAARVNFTVLGNPLVLCFAGYSLLTAVSLIHATNPTAGLSEATKTFATLVTLSLACLLLPLRQDWPLLLMKCAVIAAILGLCAGLYDWISGPGLGLHPRQEMLAVMGLMSNVNLYASFLLLLLPLCAVGVIALSGLWRYLAAFAGVLLALVIIGLQTRATYLGLAAAGSVMVVALARAAWCNGWSKGKRPAFVAIIVVLAIVLASSFLSAAGGAYVIERIQSFAGDRSMTAAGGRPVIWLASLAMIRDHFMGGVGAGNFPVHLHAYFDIDDPEFSMIHPNWLQPHNDLLWVFAEKGLLGFILYMAVWVLAFFYLLRALKKAQDPAFRWLALATLSGLAGYFVVSLFDFPMERINHQVYLAFYLAVGVLLGGACSNSVGAPLFAARRARWIFATAIAVLLAGVVYSAAALRQERLVLKSRLAFLDEDWAASLKHAQAALSSWKSLDPFAVPVVYLQGMGHLMLAQHRQALDCFQQARFQMPTRAYILNSVAVVQGMLGNYEEAIACFSEVLRRSPNHAATIHRIASTHLRAGNSRRAMELLERIPKGKWTDEFQATKDRASRQLSSEK